MKIINVDNMVMLEQKANEAGLSYAEMMKNAGVGMAQLIHNRYKDLGTSLNVLGLVGSGNNGGDTLIALIELQKLGWQTYAIVHKAGELTNTLIKTFESTGGNVINANRVREFPQIDIVMDGLLGTGGKPPLKDDMAKLIGLIRDGIDLHPRKPVFIAVDCPSGVNCETGETSSGVLHAGLTVCMAAVKVGLLKHPALSMCGDLAVVDIGLDKTFPAWSRTLGDIISSDLIKDWMPLRPGDGHKGTFGKLLVLGGSANYVGAVAMTAKAAGRSGAGLVTIASIQRVQQSVAGLVPEATWELLGENDGMIDPSSVETVQSVIGDFSSLVIGPGIGYSPQVSRFLETILYQQGGHKQSSMGFGVKTGNALKQANSILPKFVLDADGLRVIADHKDWQKNVSKDNVLTPHPGEMAALTGLTVEEIQNNRIPVSMEYAKKWQQIVVLKGAGTVVAHPDGRYAVLPVSNTALSHAGSGDVLAGIIGGILAQHVESYRAACIGVYIHGTAAKFAAMKAGSTASVLALDLTDQIGAAISSVIEYQ